jgi:MerR family transcriptional regulator, light-induced transcriptional regulator
MIKIQQLSQDVGIGVDTLRIWERRYGFPVPERDRRGHRSYPLQQLEELRIVKRLLDLGERPGQILALTAEQRKEQLARMITSQAPASEPLRELAVELPVIDLASELRRELQAKDLKPFIHDTVAPLVKLLGLGWVEGSISIAREHCISDLLEEIIKLEMSSLSAPVGAPRVLFLTLSGERHHLGLLMAAALFQQEGCFSHFIEEDLPLSEIPQLVDELEVAAVALSFSSQFPASQARKDLVELRQLLDPQVRIIAGGNAVENSPFMRGISICTDLKDIPSLTQKMFGELVAPSRRGTKGAENESEELF